MGKNEKTILLATIVALGLSVSVSVVLATWDVNHVYWGQYGPAGTRSMAGHAGKVQNGYFYEWAHWAGYTEPCPSLGAWAEVAAYTSVASYGYTSAVCKYNNGGQIITDSHAKIWIYPDGSYTGSDS